MPYYIITNYASMGNLRDCLVKSTIEKDNIDTIFDICLQVNNYLLIN